MSDVVVQESKGSSAEEASLENRCETQRSHQDIRWYLSSRLVDWGAERVVAVDWSPLGPDRGPLVTTIEQSFEDYLKTIPVIDVPLSN